MPRLLVFGQTGQVGSALAERGDEKWEITALDRRAADLRDPKQLVRAIETHRPDTIVNCAAFTDVDGAETRISEAMAVNADAPAVIAKAARQRGVNLIHLSTDYVFAGLGSRPLAETDPTNPSNTYGASKRLGEQAVVAEHPDAVILRTAWVFGPSGRNFVTTMLDLGRRTSALRVVDDQFGCPTGARDIADACLAVASQLGAGRRAGGIFHYAGQPAVSRHAFAAAILEIAGLRPTLTAISTKDWPTRAARPCNTVLDCSKIEQVWGLSAPDWRPALKRTLTSLERSAV